MLGSRCHHDCACLAQASEAHGEGKSGVAVAAIYSPEIQFALATLSHLSRLFIGHPKDSAAAPVPKCCKSDRILTFHALGSGGSRSWPRDAVVFAAPASASVLGLSDNEPRTLAISLLI